MVIYSSVTFISTLYESTATYTCDTGYVIVGDSVVTCLESAIWSSIPLCVRELPDIYCMNDFHERNAPISECFSCMPLAAISCSHPPTISNGQVTYNTITFTSIALYKCNKGYVTDGVTEIMCGSDAQWTPQPPVCTRELKW